MIKRIMLFMIVLLFILTACNSETADNNTSIKPVKQGTILCFYNSNNYSKAILPVMDSIALLKGEYVTIELINVDSMPEYIDSYGLKYIPHVIVFDSLRDTVYNKTGFYEYPRFVKMLKGKVW